MDIINKNNIDANINDYKTGAELVGKLEGGAIWRVIDYLLIKLCLGMNF